LPGEKSESVEFGSLIHKAIDSILKMKKSLAALICLFSTASAEINLEFN
jgi:hypothetical protein